MDYNLIKENFIDTIKQMFIAKKTTPLKSVIAINLLEELEPENMPNSIILNEHCDIEFKYNLPGKSYETLTISNRTVEHDYGLSKKSDWNYKRYFVDFNKSLSKEEMFWLNKTMEYFRIEINDKYGDVQC